MADRDPSPALSDEPSTAEPSPAGGVAHGESQATPDALQLIFERVDAITGCDFRPYKTSMIRRRIDRRIALHHLPNLRAYARLLETQPDEAQHLMEDLLISVTAFFREPATFGLLAEQVLPRIVQRRQAEQMPLRIWVPGCATGEDAYTLAMLVHEATSDQPSPGLQIFATDIDRRALAFARAGRYPREIAADVSEPRLERFFHANPDHTYQVCKALRESIVFAPQNLLTDPPFLRLDLICCRNVMIYLEPAIQTRLLALFHTALVPEGCLVLGQSESVGRRRELFAPWTGEQRVFRRLAPRRPQRVAFPVHSGAKARPSLPITKQEAPGPESGRELGKTIRRLVMQEYAPACAAITPRFEVLHLFGPTRRYLHLPEGEPTLNLLALVGEPARHRLRTAVQETLRTHRPTVVTAATAANPAVLRMTIRPLNPDIGDGEPVLLVVFQDAAPVSSAEHTAPASKDDADHTRSRAQLEQELQIVREDLQATIEQFESSMEQLRSSNDQIMSMNEELQAANEELETSQEELQSLNEELRTLNSQHQEKIQQLEQAHNDISNFLESTDIATVFLDTDLCIKRFTPSAARLLGLGPGDQGRPINRAMMRLTDESLLGEAATVLDRLTPVEKEIRTATGSWYTMRVLPYRTAQNTIEGVVLTFADVSRLRELIEQSQRRVAQQAIVAELGQRALEGTDLQGLMDEATRAVARTLRVTHAAVLELLPGRKELLLRAGVGWKPGMIGHARVTAGLDSQAGYTLAVSSPVVVDDIHAEKRFTAAPAVLDAGVVSGMSVVIQGGHRPFGVLGVHATEARRFGQEDVNFLQSVAHILAQAVARKTFEGELKNLNRQLEKNVEQRTAWLRLMQTTTAAANEASGIDPAVRQVLEQVCRLTGWAVGLAFMPDEAEADELFLLDCATLEQISDTTPLAEGVRRHPIRRGSGLVGRVYQSGRPTWTVQDSEEPLLSTIRELGPAVRTALALPVWAGDQVVAVLEFFSETLVQPDDRLIEVMSQIGTQLGRVIERERAARELRDREYFINSVANTAPLLFAVVDVVDNRLIYANTKAQTMLGYTAAQLREMSRNLPHHILHPDDVDAFRRMLEQLESSPPGTVIDGEYRLRHSEGTWRWFATRTIGFTRASDGTLRQVLGTLEDITERKRAEEALGESEQRFRAVFECAGLGIGLIRPDGRLAAANLALQQMLSYNETELRDLHISDLTHPDDLLSEHNRCEQVLAGDEERYEMQKRLLRQDGEPVWVHCNVSLVRARSGDPLYAIAIMQDITERRNLDQALADLALREQQRIGQDLHDNVGQELTGMSFMAHSLRNQLRKAEHPEAERVNELAEGLQRALNDVRTISHGLFPVELDTGDLQEAMIQLVHTTEAQYGISCELQVRADVPAMERDAANHLFRIIQEAIRNAVKHAGPNQIAVSLRRNSRGRFEVVVEDDGRGIDRDQNKREGIGLRIMRHRASVIGADVAVEPGSTGGTRVRCTFREK